MRSNESLPSTKNKNAPEVSMCESKEMIDEGGKTNLDRQRCDSSRCHGLMAQLGSTKPQVFWRLVVLESLQKE